VIIHHEGTKKRKVTKLLVDISVQYTTYAFPENLDIEIDEKSQPEALKP
jgi:hypothetical protein